jgi:D-xylose transport system substrate-binding protein
MRFSRRLSGACCLSVLLGSFCLGQERQIKIGFSLGERRQTDLSEFQQRVHELGAALIVRDAGGDDDVQLRQVKELLDAGIDVLVFLPHDTGRAMPIVMAAHAMNIPVISYDRLASAPVDLYVGFDLFRVGMLEARSLVEQAPRGNYLLLGGSPLDGNSRIVRAGQMKVLQPLIDRRAIRIVADIWVPEWSGTEAYLLVSDKLQHLDVPLTAIVASSDSIAGGAIQALDDQKLSGKVLVSGQDADLAAVERLFAGTQLMTVYKPAGKEACAAAEAALKLARHQDVEGLSVPNGAFATKAILLTPIAVTAQNAKDTVFKDGFQKPEAVKQGLPKEKWTELEK